jgi:glycosyltransferase involved in cell wall biosynthesis
MATSESAKISVALPVYNGADYLREALDSILAQDFADFELVVSDNCSTDETPAILAEYAARDARIRVSRTQSLLPQAANVNRSVELCGGDWVKLFCHDDVMLPGCLRAVRCAIESGGDKVGLVGNGEGWLYANGYFYECPAGGGVAVALSGTEVVKQTLGGNAAVSLPALTTATVRKEAWALGGKFDNRFAHFDIFLWMRLLMRWDYVAVPEVLTKNRIHGKQIAVGARRSLKSVEDNRLFWREFLEEFGADLRLPKATLLRTRLKGMGVAGTTIAIELLKKNATGAVSVAANVPAHWLPLLPLFVVKSFLSERRRIATLKKYVPVQLIYPG